MKKTIFSTILLVVFNILIFQSCKKEVLVLDNIENGETRDVLSFKKNGEIWKPRDANFVSGPTLSHSFNFNITDTLRDNFSINARRRIVGDNSVCIVCDWFSLRTNVIDTGFFSIMEAGIGGSTESDSCRGWTDRDFIILDSTQNNFIQIIEIDKVKGAAAGYFEFTTIDTFCQDTVIYTEGRFRLGFEEE